MTEKECLLEKFICDQNLKQLEKNYKKFNIFDCMGLNRVEIRHSYFLKWLLDPYETHGLNDSFLKIFLKNVVISKKNDLNKIRDKYFAPSVFDIDCWDMSNAEVDREIDNIDIRIVDETHKFVCIVENKIDSNQHDNQLDRYKKIIDEQFKAEDNYKKLFIYLKPKINETINFPYIYIGYDVVEQSLKELLQDKEDKISTEVHTIINHYKAILERDIMGKDKIKDDCAQLYRKHHEAIDLINQYGKPQKTICDILENILTNMDNVKNIKRTKDSEIMCLPSEIDDKKIEKLKLSDWKENDNCCVAIRFDTLKWRKDIIYCEILFAPVIDSSKTEIIQRIIKNLENNTEFKFKSVQGDWIYYNCSIKNNSDGIIISLDEYFNSETKDEIYQKMENNTRNTLELFVEPLKNAINESIA